MSSTDLAADDEAGWAGLRYRPLAQVPRLLWLPRPSERAIAKLGGVFAFLGSAFAVLDEEASDSEQAAAFVEAVDDVLHGFPVEPETQAVAPSVKLPNLPEQATFRDAALDEARTYFSSFEKAAQDLHREMQASVRTGVETIYGPGQRKLAELALCVERLRIPNGGLSEKSRAVVDKKIAAIVEERQVTQQAIEEKLAKFTKDHKWLQNRDDPRMDGKLDPSIFGDIGDLGAARQAMLAAAAALPTGRMSLLSLAAMAPILTITTAAVHFWNKTPGPFSSLLKAGLQPQYLWISGSLLGLLVLPTLVMLASWRRHAKTKRDAYAMMRVAGNAFGSYITDAMSGARDYSLNARQALLSEELVRLLEKRLDRGFLDEYQSQKDHFFHNPSPVPLDDVEKAEIRDVATAARSPRLWFRTLAALAIRRSPSSGAWSLQLTEERGEQTRRGGKAYPPGRADRRRILRGAQHRQGGRRSRRMADRRRRGRTTVAGSGGAPVNEAKTVSFGFFHTRLSRWRLLVFVLVVSMLAELALASVGGADLASLAAPYFAGLIAAAVASAIATSGLPILVHLISLALLTAGFFYLNVFQFAIFNSYRLVTLKWLIMLLFKYMYASFAPLSINITNDFIDFEAISLAMMPIFPTLVVSITLFILGNYAIVMRNPKYLTSFRDMTRKISFSSDIHPVLNNATFANAAGWIAVLYPVAAITLIAVLIGKNYNWGIYHAALADWYPAILPVLYFGFLTQAALGRRPASAGDGPSRRCREAPLDPAVVRRVRR